VLSLTALGSRFGDDQSLYGIESYGLIAGTEPQDNIEEMAQTYVDALRHDQPHGPYCLAGKCFGGVVAFEMARKLTEAGECVALLALLETGVPLRNLDRVLVALAPPERQKIEAVFARDRGQMRWAQADIEAEFERNLSSAPDGIQRMMREVYSAHRMALATYVPTPVDAPITVFRSRAGRWSERVGWDLFTRSDCHCREFDGDRDSLFEAPRVHELSQALSAAMKRAMLC
jgi:thioesterase domain-containing protein